MGGRGLRVARTLGGFCGPSLSDPRPAIAGELYDLDASSLQLKVLQYVSPCAPPGTKVPVSRPSQFRVLCPAPLLFPTYPRNLKKARGWGVDLLPDPRSASRCVPPSQLQQETQASRCCLLLVSEDSLQLSCKVRAQVHCGAGRGTGVSERKNPAHP